MAKNPDSEEEAFLKALQKMSKYKWYRFSPNSGLIEIREKDELSAPTACLDKKGNEIIPFCDHLKYLVEAGLYEAGRISDDKSKIYYGFYDTKGNKVVDLLYTKIWFMSDPRTILVEDENGNHGIFSKKGKIIIPIEYRSIYYKKSVGVFRVERKDGLEAIFDSKGKKIIDFCRITEEKWENGILLLFAKKKNATYRYIIVPKKPKATKLVFV